MHSERYLLYESGEMPPREAVEFERHLKDCPECRDALDFARKAHRMSETLVEEAPPRLLGRVLVRSHEVTLRSPSEASWRPLAVTAGAAILAATFQFSIRRPPSPPEPAARASTFDLGDAVLRFKTKLVVDDIDAGATKIAFHPVVDKNIGAIAFAQPTPIGFASSKIR